MAVRSKLSVILHADVVGSKMRVQKDEQIAHETIQATSRGFARSVEAYGGNITQLRGDAFLSEFARGSDAVLAGLSARETNARGNEELDDDSRPASDPERERQNLRQSATFVPAGIATWPTGQPLQARPRSDFLS